MTYFYPFFWEPPPIQQSILNYLTYENRSCEMQCVFHIPALENNREEWVKWLYHILVCFVIITASY